MSKTSATSATSATPAPHFAIKALREYEATLAGCRFCPMCKPASEVANLTYIESYSTRARAMLLWRHTQGMLTLTPRAIEILYQGTLDSIAEAWCVSHYPASGYMAAARAEIYAAGNVPDVVKAAVMHGSQQADPVRADTLLIAGEIDSAGADNLLSAAQTALERIGVGASIVRLHSGATAYCLGALDAAREQAAQLARVIADSGAKTVIADGAQTLWALRTLYPALGVSLPDGVRITSLTAMLAETLQPDQLPRFAGVKAFIHDGRAAAFLADSLAKAEAIQPGFNGDEQALGTGAVYDVPRQLADQMGFSRSYSVWSRSLARSSGADDGLHLAYPDLAEGLARQRLEEIKRIGAEVVITESPLSAAHLARYADQVGLKVYWLPDLIARGAL